MGARRRIAAVVLLALPLAGVPFGLAAGSPSDTLEGTLRTWHGDTFSTPVGVGAGVDTTVGGLVALEAPGQAVHALAGRRVRAHGEKRNGVFAATGGVQATSEATAAAVTGPKSVAVLLFNFSNNSTVQPWTPAYVRGVVFDNSSSVDDYLRDASYGQLSLTGDVHGWYTIDATNAGCAYTTWASQARSKATAAGVDLSAYQYIVYAFPQATSCGWAGLAYLPGTGSWINGAMTLRVVSHEVSHNLGVHHASTLACSTGTFTGTCTQSEYGDPFTVMGSAQTRHHVNWHRAQLGWLTDVQTVTASGTYLVTPAELSGTPRLVRVARNDGTYLNLEFRQPWGIFDNFSAADPVVNGVSIRIAPATTSIVQSKLVDANPGTATFSDAALGVGQTVVDPTTGVSLTTVSVGPSGASVSIQMPGGDTQPPTGPASLSATATSSSTVQLSWPAANDNVGVAGYRVYRGSTQIAQITALSYLDSGLAPSTTYAYQVRAYDAAGNLGTPASASATTQASGDVTAPSVPGGLQATVQKGRRVSLVWSAATDNVGVVGYSVYRNGVLVGSPTGTSHTDRPGRGTFTYQVRARDAAGNASGLSAPVTVTT
jgi:M6 family metalloprotease-like protein